MGLSRPYCEAVWDVFVREGLAQDAVTLVKGILFADRKRDLHPPNRLDEVGIVEVGHEVVRRYEVNVLVVVAAEKVLERAEIAGQIVTSAKRHHFAEKPWMPERQVHGVVGSNAAAVHHKRRYTIFRAHERDQLFKNVALVLTVALDAGNGWNGAAVEAFGVHAIDTEETDVATVDTARVNDFETPGKGVY